MSQKKSPERVLHGEFAGTVERLWRDDPMRLEQHATAVSQGPDDFLGEYAQGLKESGMHVVLFTVADGEVDVVFASRSVTSLRRRLSKLV